MTLSSRTPTLNDVATRSGVSTATVSRCLNFPDQVAQTTRDKVMTAVAELSYIPNFGARVMAARRTNTIGAIIPTMENSIFARGLQAFQEELGLAGITLLVASSSYRAEIEEQQIRSLVARGADGLLLIGCDRDERIHQFLEAQNVPSLITWAIDPRSNRLSVGFDNRVAMRDLAREVLAMGHRQLAVISAPTVGNDRARSRLDGIRDAVQEVGLNPADLPVIETPYGIENGSAAMAELMRYPLRPTVVMCGNDVLAAGALRCARELGLDVPRDVSVTGFDDIELAQVVFPALATVHVPHREMGRCAARVLIDLVRNGLAPASITLKTDVKLRGSLAPVHDPGL